MKSLIAMLAVVVLAPLANAQQHRRGPFIHPPAPNYENLIDSIYHATPYYTVDANKSCSCNELTRRVAGLRLVLEMYASRGIYENAFPALTDVRLGAEKGQQALNYAAGKHYDQQTEACNNGANLGDAAWVRWQPKLGYRGLDYDYYTGVKVASSSSQPEGDLNRCADSDGKAWGRFSVRNNNDVPQWTAAELFGVCSLERGLAEIQFHVGWRDAESSLPEPEKKKCYLSVEPKQP